MAIFRLLYYNTPMTRRQQLTYIIGGFVFVSLVVLGMRWSVLADRVPLNLPASEAIAGQQESERKSNYTPPAKPKKKYKPYKSDAKKKASSKLIDINRASATSLEELPGIGPVIAKRIVTYRKLHGPYAKLSDLDRVEGIGQKKLEELEGLATCSSTR